MKICEHCGHEIAKTVKIPELGIEVDIEVTQKNTAFKDIKFPEGKRLLTLGEVVWLANSNYAKILKMDLSSSDDDFFFQQPLECNRKKGYVAKFVADFFGACLGCGGGPDDRGASLGVRFCRNLEEK